MVSYMSLKCLSLYYVVYALALRHIMILLCIVSLQLVKSLVGLQGLVLLTIQASKIREQFVDLARVGLTHKQKAV